MVLPIIVSIATAALKVVTAVASMRLSIEKLMLVSNILVSIAKLLGLLDNPEIEAEELGDKALQAEEEGIKPENYDTYDEYVKAIEEFEIDPEKSKEWSSSEKALKGIELSSALIIEKYGPDVQSLLLEVARSPEFFDSKRLKLYLDTIPSSDIGYSEVSDYLSGNTRSNEVKESTRNIMIGIEKKIDSDISDVDAQRNINGQKY